MPWGSAVDVTKDRTQLLPARRLSGQQAGRVAPYAPLRGGRADFDPAWGPWL